jgi:SAM-dependent methyltransferase
MTRAARPQTDGPDPEWEAFAAREPYFAVLSAPRFRRDRLTPGHEREFFTSGERLVEWMFGVIDGVFPLFAPASTLEYGCGPGRLALPLARRPGSVTAVDRSPAMLALAREHAQRHGLGHIDFQTPDTFFAVTRTFDLVVCYHVLQRMQPADAAALVARLIDRIGPGGIGVFQWPLRARRTSPAVRLSRWVREHVPGANGFANRLLKKPAGEPSHLYDETGRLLIFDHVCQPLTDPPRPIRPGETVRCVLVVPALGAGRYRLELDCVASDVTWFAQAGSRPAAVVVDVT